MEEHNGVSLALAEVESRAGTSFQTEGIGQVVLHLVGGTEAGKRVADCCGEVFRQPSQNGGGFCAESEECAGFGFGHFFVIRERWRGGMEIDFGRLARRCFAQRSGEKRTDAAEARGECGGLRDEECAEVDRLAASEGAPDAGTAAAHFVIVLHVVEDE